MPAAHVQSTGVQSVGSVASVSRAFVSNVAAGNLLLVGGTCYEETLTATSATDSQGNAYTRDGNILHPTVGGQSAIYSGVAGSSAACTVTLDPTGSAYVSIAIAEFSGMDTSGTRLEAQATGNGTTTSAVASGNIVTAVNTVIVGVMTYDGSAETITPNGSYTQMFEDEDASDMPISWIRRTTTPIGAGTYTVAWTLGTSPDNGWTCAGAAYKEAAAATGAIPPALIRSASRWTHRTRRVYR